MSRTHRRDLVPSLLALSLLAACESAGRGGGGSDAPGTIDAADGVSDIIADVVEGPSDDTTSDVAPIDDAALPADTGIADDIAVTEPDATAADTALIDDAGEPDSGPSVDAPDTSTDDVPALEDTSDVPPFDVTELDDVPAPDDTTPVPDVPEPTDVPALDDIPPLPDTSEPDTNAPDTSEPPAGCTPFTTGSGCGPGAWCFPDFFTAGTGGCLALAGDEGGLGEACTFDGPGECCGASCSDDDVTACTCALDTFCCTGWDEICVGVAMDSCNLGCEPRCGAELVCLDGACVELCETPGESACPASLVCSGLEANGAALAFGACLEATAPGGCPLGTSPCATAPDVACCADTPYFESDGDFGGATPVVSARSDGTPRIVFIDWDVKEAKVASLDAGTWNIVSLGPATGVPLLDPLAGDSTLTVTWETPASTAGGMFTPSQGRFATVSAGLVGPVHDIPAGRQPIDVAGPYVLAKDATGHWLHAWNGTVVTSTLVGPETALDADIESSGFGTVTAWSVLAPNASYALWVDDGFGADVMTEFSPVSKTDFIWGGGKALFVFRDGVSKHVKAWQQFTANALLVPLVEVATDNMDATSDADGVWHLCYRAGGALHHLKKAGVSSALGALGTGNCTVSAVKGGGAGIAWRSAGDTDRLEYLWVKP